MLHGGNAEAAFWLAVTAEQAGAEAAQQALPIASSNNKPVRLAAQFASNIHGLILAFRRSHGLGGRHPHTRSIT